MKIIAFDQATKVTGYAVIADGKLLRHGTLTVKASLDITSRMYWMIDAICELITSEQPDAVFFEGVEGVKNERTMIYLANLQGMCLYGSRAVGYIANTIDVATWRHTLGFTMGRGVKRGDLKTQAVQYVRDIYCVECGDDEAEAICIATVAWKKSLESKE